MWVFIRTLPLIIGSKITVTEDAVWQLILALRQMVELICAPIARPENIALMKDTIEEYIERRMECFPEVKLKPKHHFVSHYPALTVCFGPLIRLWTLRFESKHFYFKKAIRNGQNFINVTKTCADKHQLLQALYSAGSLSGPAVCVMRSVPFNIDVYNVQLRSAVEQLPKLCCGSDTEVAEQVSVHSIIYEKGAYVVLSREY